MNQLRTLRTGGANVFVRPFTDILTKQSQSARHSSVREVATSPGTPSKRHRRYEVFKAKLKKLGIYAEWRARRLLFDAADASAAQRLTVAKFRRAVGEAARVKATENNFDLPRNSFHAASDSVFKIMLNAEVLRAEGNIPIKPNDNEFSIRVCGLARDFRVRCDLYVLENLIFEFGDITSEDFLSIAHLFYGGGRKEEEGGVSLSSPEIKVEDLFAEFGDRLSKDASGFYRVKAAGSEKVQPISAGQQQATAS